MFGIEIDTLLMLRLLICSVSDLLEEHFFASKQLPLTTQKFNDLIDRVDYLQIIKSKIHFESPHWPTSVSDSSGTRSLFASERTSSIQLKLDTIDGIAFTAILNDRCYVHRSAH